MDIRISHSEALDRGGALVVAEHLARTFDAPLHLGFKKPELVADDINGVELFDSYLPRMLSDTSSLFRDAYFSLAWQHVPELHDADVVIESGNNPAWYVPRDTQAVVRYVHSTPYGAYHRFHRVGDSFFGKLYGTALRTLYQQTIPYPDVWVANSELVARRIERYWGVSDVDVVYPPVDVSQYERRERSDYYFTFSHLRPEKRVGEMIRAFDGLDERLVVGGDGPERQRLGALSPENVTLVGYMDEEEKRRRLGEAQAFLFNARSEDFGIVPIEAFASGTPVIGVSEGYTKHQIRDGKNGVLFDPGIDSLRTAVRQFELDRLDWSRKEIERDAERFDVDRFRSRMRAVVQQAVAASGIEVEHE